MINTSTLTIINRINTIKSSIFTDKINNKYGRKTRI